MAREDTGCFADYSIEDNNFSLNNYYLLVSREVRGMGDGSKEWRAREEGRGEILEGLDCQDGV